MRTREKYILGGYDVIYRVGLSSVHLSSVDRAVPVRPVTSRRLLFSAAGRVQVKVEENLVAARKTVRIDPLRANIEMRFDYELRGIRLSYDAEITGFRADAASSTPLLDGRLRSALRQGLADLLNSKRLKERLSQLMLPQWIPTDIRIEMALSE